MGNYKIGTDFELKATDLKLENSKIKKKSLPLPAYLLNVGFYIVAPLIIAIPVGLYLDKQFNTRNIFTLLLIFFGFFSTIYNLGRLTKNS